MAYCALHKQSFADDDPCPFCFPVEFDDDDDSDLEDDMIDFQMDPGGFCGKAGSEECEFECPYRDEEGI